ncbi:uncharacterized protein LOC110687687 [Chenopodium quinoa]|uniref:uncharacterized protein LOC110687687 n=1 Tax=Chenopodium quinoa TaxID=63459 RepID=UPI000B782F76|nr:uncharacterized protein LOC110687687 [Chenopodium quinoa]
MIIGLSTKNKLSFVDGTLPTPISGDVNYKAYVRCNDLVIGWILGVLGPVTKKSVFFYKTAREMWKDLEERYGQVSSTKLYGIQEQISAAHEETEEIAEFFVKIKVLWDQLDDVNPIQVCTCNGCVCNVTSDPLPTLPLAYRMLLQEQKHKQISEHVNIVTSLEAFAFAADKRKFTDRPSFQCFKLKGYPPNFKANNQKKFANIVQGDGSFSADQFDDNNDGSDLTPKDDSAMSSTAASKEENKSAAYFAGKMCLFSAFKNGWIIDSGATDHICYDLYLFDSYSPLQHGDNTITISDGNEVVISQIGEVTLEQNIVLKNDPSLAREIVLGRQKSGLYHVGDRLPPIPFEDLNFPTSEDLDSPTSTSVSSHTVTYASAENNNAKLWHLRMTWIHMLQFKSDSVQILFDFVTFAEKQHNCIVKFIRTYNAKEFTRGGIVELHTDLTEGYPVVPTSQNLFNHHSTTQTFSDHSSASQTNSDPHTESVSSNSSSFYTQDTNSTSNSSSLPYPIHSPSSSAEVTDILSSIIPECNLVSYSSIPETKKALAVLSSAIKEPSTYKEASKHPDWINARQKELEALQKNHTWEIVNLLAGKKPIGCKWVFKIKLRADGTIERFKAKLVAKGWKSKKQPTTLRSSSKSDYRAMACAAAEVTWMSCRAETKLMLLLGLLNDWTVVAAEVGYGSAGCRLLRRGKGGSVGCRKVGKGVGLFGWPLVFSRVLGGSVSGNEVAESVRVLRYQEVLEFKSSCPKVLRKVPKLRLARASRGSAYKKEREDSHCCLYKAEALKDSPRAWKQIRLSLVPGKILIALILSIILGGNV